MRYFIPTKGGRFESDDGPYIWTIDSDGKGYSLYDWPIKEYIFMGYGNLSAALDSVKRGVWTEIRNSRLAQPSIREAV